MLSAPVAPLVENLLNAADHVAAAGLEMDARLEAQLHSALLRLVHAVYEHHDSLELQRELEEDGVREAHVFDITGRGLPVTSYSAHVERITEAADTVSRAAGAATAGSLPAYALPPLATLVEAVSMYQSQAAVAHDWEVAGNRLRVIPGGLAESTQPPAPTTPPAAPPPVYEEADAPSADGVASQNVAVALSSGAPGASGVSSAAGSDEALDHHERAALRARLR